MDVPTCLFKTEMVCFCGSPLHRFLKCYAMFFGLIFQRGEGERERWEQIDAVKYAMEKLDRSLAQLSTEDSFFGKCQRASD